MKRVQLVAAEAARPDEHVVFLCEKEGLEGLERALTPEEAAFLKRSAELEATSFFFPRERGSISVWLGKADKNQDVLKENLRLAGAELLKDLQRYKIQRVFLRSLSEKISPAAFAEGMALAGYRFLKYFSETDKKDKPLEEIRIDVKNVSSAEIAEIDALVESVFLARNLVNEPYGGLNAEVFSETVVSCGEEYGFSVEILGKEKIESLKMGGLLAVNRASKIPPAFAILEWMPEGAVNERPMVLVGKGVMFDTGGHSLKTAEGMEYMKSDMGGAAAVLGVFTACAQNKLPVRLVGLIPITDNMISDTGMVPGDVIRMYSGKTVEVLNTDAEGRLILADALHYAKKYNPQLVIDLATLTGSAMRALGVHGICYMGTASKAVKHDLESSGFAVHERLVEFPLWKEYGDELKSRIADLKNVGSGNAGMITAGKFLENFVDYPWLHLDIAGPAYLRAAVGYRPKEGTGVGVRLLYDFLKKHFLNPR